MLFFARVSVLSFTNFRKNMRVDFFGFYLILVFLSGNTILQKDIELVVDIWF